MAAGKRLNLPIPSYRQGSNMNAEAFLIRVVVVLTRSRRVLCEPPHGADGDHWHRRAGDAAAGAVARAVPAHHRRQPVALHRLCHACCLH